jgi:hypothetical protein
MTPHNSRGYNIVVDALPPVIEEVEEDVEMHAAAAQKLLSILSKRHQA